MSELGDADNAGRASPGAAASPAPSRRRSSRPATTTSTSCAGCSSAQGDEIAAIIVEPVLGNAQGIMPKPGLPPGDAGADRGVRDPADLRRGQDRLPLRAGGAAEFFGITPDLATYAKAMGNGYPAAAFGGRREVMSVLPDKVSHGGTYAGNRVAAAAAVKTLSILKDTDALETIHATGRRIQDGLTRDPQPDRARRTTSPGTRRCSGSCSARRRRPSTATGPPRTTSCTTRSRSACTPVARCRSPTRASRGSCARRTPRATSIDRVARPPSPTRSTPRSRPAPTVPRHPDAPRRHGHRPAAG